MKTGLYREVAVVERWPILAVPLYYIIFSDKRQGLLIGAGAFIRINMVLLRCEY